MNEKQASKLRTGDLVLVRVRQYQGEKGKLFKGVITGTPKDWWCIRGCVGTRTKRYSHDGWRDAVTQNKDIEKLVMRREKVKKWWNWI